MAPNNPVGPDDPSRQEEHSLEREANSGILYRVLRSPAVTLQAPAPALGTSAGMLPALRGVTGASRASRGP